MSDDQDLQPIRERIDAIDADLLRLISERAECARRVAEIKAADGAVQFYRPEREAQILRRIQEINPGPLRGEEVARLFREIMSACLALERPVRAAFLGPEGTFTQAATRKHFGHSVQTVPMATIGDIFSEVEAGACDYGVVPVENSTEGVISHTLDLFMTSPLRIVGEVSLRIHHHLMGNTPELTAIKAVYSHQQSLAQCRGWLDRHLPQAATMTTAFFGAGDDDVEVAFLALLAGRVHDELTVEAGYADRADTGPLEGDVADHQGGAGAGS